MSPGPLTPDGSERPVVVVGGGIAGLTAAYALTERHPDVPVVVLEGAARPGGKLRREEVGGVLVDVGAESFLARRPEALALAREVGLESRLVHPATTAARIWSGGAMRRLPRSVMGVPADLEDLRTSGLLSEEGVARAAREPDVAPSEVGEDVSVGALVEERFGPEVVDRMLEPLLGGVYAGHARELSARAAVPQVVAMLAQDPSLLRGAARVTGASSDAAPAPVFAGLDGGVGVLAETLAARLDVRCSTTVRVLERDAGGFRLVTGPASDPTVVEARAVVLAVPAPAAARLLATVAPDAATGLATVEVASTAVVTLAVPEAQVPAGEGSGFLVPPVDGRAVKAATYSFRKWDWVRRDGSEQGLVLLRASLGRHRQEAQLQRDDDGLVALALDDLADAVGARLAPVDHHVQRWGGGLPQYAVGHLDLVDRVRAAVAEVPGLAVCGATYDGVGVPACIASARAAADQVSRVLGGLGSQSTMEP